MGIFYDKLLHNFGHTPGKDQNELFDELEQFVQSKVENKAFVLTGYAGTGKTSSINALVKSLKSASSKYVMMAPTGRAAKVMAGYTQSRAFTIHKFIYSVEDGEKKPIFKKNKNNYTNTLFIVDEASMIGSKGGFGLNSLLHDLVSYVYEGDGNSLLLIGDTAQLPPVGESESSALNSRFLEQEFNLNMFKSELTEVMRQKSDSGILENATQLRACISSGNINLGISTKDYPDVFKMTGERLEDGLRYAYDKYGVDNTIIICRSNKQANQYNQYIRKAIFFYNNELDAGDRLMIVKNNYSALPKDSKVSFLANGDFAEIIKVGSDQELYGHRFCDVDLRLTDYSFEDGFSTKLILDTLYSNNPSLTNEESKKLFKAVMDDYKDESHGKKMKLMKEDSYANALQVKFAYAITCHKAQGGQWDAVFIDQGFFTEDMLDTEYLRWLYTAFTRPVKELFLVNFKL